MVAIFSVTAAMIGAGDNECFSSFPEQVEQPFNMGVYILQCSSMGMYGVFLCTVYIEIVRVMDAVNVQIQKNPLILIVFAKLSFNKAQLVFKAVFDVTAKGWMPVTAFKQPWKYFAQFGSFIEKVHSAHTDCLVTNLFKPFDKAGAFK